MGAFESSLWEAELRREIERLRSEVRELRSARDGLADELARSREELRHDRDPSVDDAAALDRDAVRASAVGRPGRPSSNWIALTGVAGLSFAIGILSQRPAAGEVQAAAKGTDLPYTGRTTFSTVVGSPSSERNADASAHEASLAPEGAAEIESAPRGELAARAPRDVAERRAGPAGSTTPLPRTIADIEGGHFEGVDASGEPCVFAARVFTPEFAAEALGSSRATSVDDLREALGPCFGGHVATGDGGTLPAGTYRVDGVACCRHHAYIERLTAASRDEDSLRRLLDEAEVAQRDGLLPPLVRRRAARAASRFLKDRVGRWSEAGIDSGTGSHRWERIDGDQMRRSLPSGVPSDDCAFLRLHSWVRLAEDMPIRSFTMDLALSDARSGDVLMGFDRSSE